jgi:hypothetical protein
VTGASCASVDIGIRAADTTVAGESANATVWADNALLWNQTATGMTSMPWCDLRAVVSPATLVVSGLLGDLPSPAFLALGAYISSITGGGSLPSGGALSFYLGRKGVSSPRALLVNGSQGAYPASFTPQSIAAPDSGSYGGLYTQATVSGGWNPRFFSGTAADAAGSYHLLARVKSDQTSPAIQQVKFRVVNVQQTDPWVGLVSGTDLVGQWAGGSVAPLATPSAWAVVDAGPCALPPFPGGALSDPTKLYLIPRAQWTDGSGGSAAGYTNWQALLPVDGSLLVATINNPGNSGIGVTNQWVYAYADGLLLNRAGASDGPSWAYSLESKPQPNPAGAAGGAGTQTSGAVNVNSGADPYLLLDPQQSGLGGASTQPGVNQIVAIIADASTTASVLPCFAEVSYAPLYLEPR